MIKIGYAIQDTPLIQKMHRLYWFNCEIQLFKLDSFCEKELLQLEIEILVVGFRSDEANRLDEMETLCSRLDIRGIWLIDSYSDEMIHMLLKHHCNYYCDFDISAEGLYLLVLRILNEPQNKPISKYEMIQHYMKGSQMPQHLKGYDYMKTALFYVFEHEKQEIEMQAVYQMIARKYQTTQSRVERNLRKAVDCAVTNKGIGKMSNKKYLMLSYYECKGMQHG